jgi:hypothetical protein
MIEPTRLAGVTPAVTHADSVGRPVIVANPSDDDAFTAHVAMLVDDGVETPEALQLQLRRRYPLAVVRPRDLSGEARRLWYVYREGRWVAIGDGEA